jgi:hypothetical protein
LSCPRRDAPAGVFGIGRYPTTIKRFTLTKERRSGIRIFGQSEDGTGAGILVPR